MINNIKTKTIMGNIKAPDLPAPRSDDKEFNKIVCRWLDTEKALDTTRGERDAWRKAFYAVAILTFAFLIALLVLCGSKFFTLHFSLFT